MKNKNIVIVTVISAILLIGIAAYTLNKKKKEMKIQVGLKSDNYKSTMWVKIMEEDKEKYFNRVNVGDQVILDAGNYKNEKGTVVYKEYNEAIGYLVYLSGIEFKTKMDNGYLRIV